MECVIEVARREKRRIARVDIVRRGTTGPTLLYDDQTRSWQMGIHPRQLPPGPRQDPDPRMGSIPGEPHCWGSVNVIVGFKVGDPGVGRRGGAGVYRVSRW